MSQATGRMVFIPEGLGADDREGRDQAEGSQVERRGIGEVLGPPRHATPYAAPSAGKTGPRAWLSASEGGCRAPRPGATGEDCIVKIFVVGEPTESHRHHRLRIDQHQRRTGAIRRLEYECVDNGWGVAGAPRVHLEFDERIPDATYDRGESCVTRSDRRREGRRERGSDHGTNELALRVVHSKSFGPVA